MKTVNDGLNDVSEQTGAAETSVTYELGTLEQSKELNFAGGSERVEPYQSMPKTQLGNFLHRMTRIKYVDLVSTNTPLALVTASFDPWTLFLADTVIADKTKNFAYIRGTMCLKFVTTAPAGAYGLYIISAICNGGNITMTGDTELNAVQPVETALQTIHTRINLANSNNCEIELPFVWPYDFSKLPTGPVNMWQINMWCYMPITSSTSDSTLTGSIVCYAYLKDEEMVIPIQQGKFNIPGKLSEKRDSINDKVKSLTGGKKASEVADSIGKMAETAGKYIPFISSLTGPIASGAAMASSVLGWMGFTRDTNQQTPTVIVDRPYSNVANMDVNDTGEIAGLCVSNTISFDPQIAGNISHEDVSSFADLFGRYTLVKVFDWSSADATNAVLGSFLVTPFLTRAAFGTPFVLPVAGFVGLPFLYWRGDMEYLLLIPVSKFHRGSLQLSWSPTGSVSGEITNELLNVIIDVTADDEWQINVGYARDYPVLESRIMWNATPAIVPVDIACNGEVIIQVVNPLTSSVESAAAKIFVFAACKENMQFGVPKMNELRYVNAGAAPTMHAFDNSYYFQGALGDEPTQTNVLTLVPPSKAYPAKELLWGEGFASVRALMQKFSTDHTLEEIVTEHLLLPTVAFPHFQSSPMVGQNDSYGGQTSPYFTFFGYYKALFMGIACSTRYKIINASVPQTPFGNTGIAVAMSKFPVFEGLNAEFHETTLSTVAPVWVIGNGEAVEITVPYYSRKKYFQTRYENCNSCSAGILSSGNEMDILAIRLNSILEWSEENFTPACKIFVAAGPDLRLIMFRFTPALNLNLVNEQAPTWVGPDVAA